MKLYKFFLFSAVTLCSLPSFAEDCLVKTDFRSLMTGVTGLQEEKNNEAEGRYTAILKNGDVVLAQFATCDLGMQVSYLSVKALDNAELMQRLEMFLTRVLPSKTVIDKVLPQLKALKSSALQKPVILQGLNDQHQLVVKSAASPNFHTIIQYNWITPEY